ncbi:hypothetical protein M501DRAFT_1013051 [Patellaria atrata CBS 101060]|uniref:Uncharacterized protein n=1 Tax=Patellaria atrata CBS 101060 TaxID=1346257 RepID=A0A9P4SJA0_9PEZI|nr:hypothetical protein M501DRAFT_1013051 [Patellaria atrata CBS 101060]
MAAIGNNFYPRRHAGKKPHHKYLQGSSNDAFTTTSRKAPSQKATISDTTKNTGVEEEESGDGCCDEDSDSSDEDSDEQDEDDPEEFAPSDGPAVHIDSVDTKGGATPNSSDRGAGLITNRLSVTTFESPSKKRTFSNVSNTSLLYGTSDSDGQKRSMQYPRKKLLRRLSNNPQGLLSYEGVLPSKKLLEQGLQVSDNAIESSDDDYAGVELVSDSEDNEPDMEKLEEQMIINSEAGLDLFSRRDSISSIGSDMFDFALIGGEPLDPEGDFFDIPSTIEEVAELTGFDPFKATPTSNGRKPSDGSTRRVRFDLEDSKVPEDAEVAEVSDSSSSTSSGADSALFPDLFLQQDQLDPSFRYMIENEMDLDIGNTTASDGEWELNGDASNVSHGIRTESEGSGDSEAGSSGYETDDGETTDEDLPPPATVHRPSALLQRQPSVNLGEKSSPKPFKRSKPQPPKRKGPVMGQWTVDPNKAYALIDSSGKKLILYAPRNTTKESVYWNESSGSSTVNNSPRTPYRPLTTEDSDLGDIASHQFTMAPDLMLGGFFGTGSGPGSLLAGQVIGPEEAFYPFINIDTNGFIVPSEESYDDEDDDEDNFDEDLDIQNFIDFGDGNSDSDDMEVLASPATSTATQIVSTPVKPVDKTPAAKILEHLDRSNVTAFRSNQHRSRKLASLPQHPSHRRASMRPVRLGGSVETPITPVRRRKSSNVDLHSSPLATKPLSRKLRSSRNHRGT